MRWGLKLLRAKIYEDRAKPVNLLKFLRKLWMALFAWKSYNFPHSYWKFSTKHKWVESQTYVSIYPISSSNVGINGVRKTIINIQHYYSVLCASRVWCGLTIPASCCRPGHHRFVASVPSPEGTAIQGIQWETWCSHPHFGITARFISWNRNY